VKDKIFGDKERDKKRGIRGTKKKDKEKKNKKEPLAKASFLFNI
jgi:hypothetical protein